MTAFPPALAILGALSRGSLSRHAARPLDSRLMPDELVDDAAEAGLPLESPAEPTL